MERTRPRRAMDDLSFEQRLAWAEAQMPATRAACAALPDLSAMRLAYAGHLTLNITAALAAFLERGAALFLTTCNPATVRDEVVDFLKQRGAEAYAWHAMPEAAYHDAFVRALAWQPTHTCEMGAELSALAHRKAVSSIRAALESTGSGIRRLAGQRLHYPVFNADDLPIKEGLHNRHMVGLTTWQTFFETTHLSLHGKRVVVVGYGLVGRGVAASARAYGGVVSVVERDAERRLEARYDGWHTASLAALAPEADVLVTATGAAGVVRADVLARLKPGCFVLNVGHTADEIDTAALAERRRVLPHVEACRAGDHEIYLLAGGAMFNLAAGRGDSLNAFDVTAAVLVAGLGFLATPEAASAPPGLHALPAAVWQAVAAYTADAEGW